MNEAPSTEKIEFFLRNVFDYLDRNTEFTDRPMADERHWVGQDAPIVQLIFMDDVANKRRIMTNYVTLFVTGQVFSLVQYVNACVQVMQSLPEEDIPDIVIEYVEMLINVYSEAVHQKVDTAVSNVSAAIREAEEEAQRLELDVASANEEPSDQDIVNPTPLEKLDNQAAARKELARKDKPHGWS